MTWQMAYSEVGDEVKGWLDPEWIETLHPRCIVIYL